MRESRIRARSWVLGWILAVHQSPNILITMKEKYKSSLVFDTRVGMESGYLWLKAFENEDEVLTFSKAEDLWSLTLQSWLQPVLARPFILPTLGKRMSDTPKTKSHSNLKLASNQSYIECRLGELCRREKKIIKPEIKFGIHHAENRQNRRKKHRSQSSIKQNRKGSHSTAVLNLV